MNLIELIILAVVQGLTEFIPVSSSGHLVALESWFESDSSLAFEILLHVGTLIALITHYFAKVKDICVETFRDRNIHFARNLVVSTVPVVIVGFAVAAFFDDASWRTVNLVAFMLVAVGLLMLIVDKKSSTKISHIDNVTLKDAAVVGLFQAVSILPGTSRSGITMIGARIRGMAYDVAAEYSFLLAIPALLGATFYVLVSEGTAALNNFTIFEQLLAVIVSAAVGLMAIRIMITFLKKYGFAPFAYYRIALGLLLLVVL